MKKILSLALLGLALSANAQQVNGDFDATWENNKPWDSQNGYKEIKGYTQPQGWVVSNVSGINGLGATKVAKQVMGRSGEDTDYAVQLTNTANPFSSSQIVPAYINLGVSWATAKATFSGSVSDADGGCFGGKGFSYKPDALTFYYKRSHGTAKATENASVVAYMWKGIFKQTNVPGNTTMKTPITKTMYSRDRVVLNHDMTGCQGDTPPDRSQGTLIAQIESYISGDAAEWTQYTVPFTYTSTETPDSINIIISANDYFADRSTIGVGNSITVDDVELVYYHSLSDLKYNEVTLEGFDENTLNYSVDDYYEASKVSYTKTGRTSTVSQNYDENTGVLTITVANAGYETTYRVQFKTAQTYVNDLTVSVDGETAAPQETSIQLINEIDGTHSFVLKNFFFGEMPIGNIYLKNLTVEGNKYTTNQTIEIQEGDDKNLSWMGPLLREVPVILEANLVDGEMTAKIDIDMSATLEQIIKVVIAKTTNISKNADVVTSAGLANIVLNRSFNQGWSTICLPFATTPKAIGAEGAQAFTSESNNVLNFSKVENMEANTPYIVYFSTEKSDPMYFGVEVENAKAKSVNNGGNFTFKGNYTAGMSMDGLYGVATIDGEQKIVKGSTNSTLPATCAYFTNSGTMGAAYAIRLEGEEITGINAINNGMAEDGAVYNLQGVKVSNSSMKNLPAGLYIMNGKKFIIK